jgi:hypothetical protein
MLSHVIRLSLLLSLIVCLSSPATAQSGQDSIPKPSPEVISGGYVIHQSIDFGVRVSDTNGSGAMYDTLVNLHTGPRVLDQMLSMRSENHQGILFDNLLIHSIGWGGDPNNYLRFSADKNNWYDFRASFRRDQDFFNYNLLANPLNPTSSVPNVPVGSSPHSFETRRRMSDFDLTLLPQSLLSFRLGYSRNNMTGRSYSSIHEGTDAYLYQPWNTTLNSYRAGVDLRFAPRTVLSYDQFLDLRFHRSPALHLCSRGTSRIPHATGLSPTTAFSRRATRSPLKGWACAAITSAASISPRASAILAETRAYLPSKSLSTDSSHEVAPDPSWKLVPLPGGA